MNTSLRLPVTDSSQAGEARRMAATWARERGCDDDLKGSVALVVTELANNLARHTRGGVLLLRSLEGSGHQGVEILSLDSGPGVRNINECMRDGYSTAGTSGAGLGAVRRASQIFDVHSQPAIGTAVLSGIWSRSRAPAPAKYLSGAASVAYDGEPVCGDTWAVQATQSDRVRIVVADGLGHGEMAADASRKAIEVFANGARLTVIRLMETMHGALRGTRGAAIAVGEIDLSAGTVTYVGIGNIATTILHREKTTSLVSLNGTVGAQYRALQAFTYPWTTGAALIMQSDGIKTNWQLDRYIGLSERHPGLIAGVLYRDFHRPTDDSTVVVIRQHP
jgi:anti-sigma regulatory factor (Ser/Thr protein kinase)